MTIREYIKIGKVGDIINGGFVDDEVVEEICYDCIVVRTNSPQYISKKKWDNLEWNIIIINSKNKNMNITEKFTLALTKEPQKSFRKAGITNGDDILTEDGEKVFLSWLLNVKFAEEFKKDVVNEMLEKGEDKK